MFWAGHHSSVAECGLSPQNVGKPEPSDQDSPALAFSVIDLRGLNKHAFLKKGVHVVLVMEP